MATTDTKSTTRSSTSGDRPKHSRGTQEQRQRPPEPAGVVQPDAAGDGGRSVSVWTMLLFLVGCGILVVAAINLPNLGRWGDQHGNVLVFLCFFLVMSIGGRWFWAGIDALWGAVRNKEA
ncbi:hypothetical protein [Gordonia liuliyuniae]|uniref:hypothetical protein n=1 Tax=Gordonia liuliyuniae TaxID=2911517 RepID=UPI001F282E11|nr:hypothetical protein [Gordonia liuliyuniae]